jgi:hypothetical protein
MQTSTLSPTTVRTTYRPSNCETAQHLIPAAWTLSSALSEVKGLWNSTETAIQSARESLYEFLGATYEHAQLVSRSPVALGELRSTVRRQYVSDHHKKRAEQAPAEELILTVALGIGQGSLRSKYKALLSKALDEEVPFDRESFIDWLRNTGGIVKALQETISSPDRKVAPTAHKRSFDSCAGDLLRDLHSRPLEERALTKEPYKGFAIALVYVDPKTKQIRLVSELTDGELIEHAVRLASEQQTGAVSEAEAA